MGVVNVIVACGSGICTSSVIEQRLYELAEENGFEIKVTKTTLGSLDAYLFMNDMLVTAGDFSDDTQGLPHVTATAVISGINEDAFEQEFISTAKAIAEKK